MNLVSFLFFHFFLFLLFLSKIRTTKMRGMSEFFLPKCIFNGHDLFYPFLEAPIYKHITQDNTQVYSFFCRIQPQNAYYKIMYLRKCTWECGRVCYIYSDSHAPFLSVQTSYSYNHCHKVEHSLMILFTDSRS
jgi:hypothetical protein